MWSLGRWGVGEAAGIVDCDRETAQGQAAPPSGRLPALSELGQPGLRKGGRETRGRPFRGERPPDPPRQPPAPARPSPQGAPQRPPCRGRQRAVLRARGAAPQAAGASGAR